MRDHLLGRNFLKESAAFLLSRSTSLSVNFLLDDLMNLPPGQRVCLRTYRDLIQLVSSYMTTLSSRQRNLSSPAPLRTSKASCVSRSHAQSRAQWRLEASLPRQNRALVNGALRCCSFSKLRESLLDRGSMPR